MTKELKALEKIKQFIKPTQAVVKYDNGEQQSFYSHTLGELFPKEFDIIETALKEHKLMKDIRITARFDLAQVNKEHKALEIIKEKEVNVEIFNSCPNLYEYNNWATHLTEEEYNLLKEVLL